MKTLVTLLVEHRKPVADLETLIAGRAYTIDNVTNVTVETTQSAELSEKQRQALRLLFDVFSETAQ